MRSLYRASIWHPEAIPHAEGALTREMKRVVLPAFDGVIIIMAVGAIFNGMPSFETFHDTVISTIASWSLLIGGVLALVGVSFPALWQAEAAGKLIVLVVLGGYFGALVGLVAMGDGRRVFAAGAFFGLMILPLWNLARLGRERRVRQAIDRLRAGGST